MSLRQLKFKPKIQPNGIKNKTVGGSNKTDNEDVSKDLGQNISVPLKLENCQEQITSKLEDLGASKIMSCSCAV